jgi:hypothetical protein
MRKEEEGETNDEQDEEKDKRDLQRTSLVESSAIPLRPLTPKAHRFKVLCELPHPQRQVDRGTWKDRILDIRMH